MKIRGLIIFLTVIIALLGLTACDAIGSVIPLCDVTGHDYTIQTESDEYVKSRAKTCAENDTYWYACSACGVSAGSDPDAADKYYQGAAKGSHKLTANWVSDGEYHLRKCTVEGCEHTEGKEKCSGTDTATCVKRAICETCGNAYGELGAHTFDTSTYGYKNPEGHAHKCTFCDAHDELIKHTPSVSDTSGAAHYRCSDPDCKYPLSYEHSYTVIAHDETSHWYECDFCDAEKPGSRTAHSGGTAGCTSLAVCTLCSTPYGEAAGHKYSERVTVEPATFTKGEKLYSCSGCTDSYTAEIPATKSLKILSIGNSFSQDAMEHLYIVCRDAGIETILLGNLYKGGCSLQTHLSCMTGNTESYTFYVSSAEKGGMTTLDSTATAQFAITYADWDFITLQQASGQSGVQDSYSYLDGVIDYVNGLKNASAKLVWHMTWAYQGNSTHSSFPTYGSNQMTMYNAIISATNAKILTRNDFALVIPSGTAVQNLRTSHLGDTLTRDGYHMSRGIGRYTTALTYLAAITGYDVSNISAVPSEYPEVADHLDCIKDAVKSAIATPYSITASAYPPDEKLTNTTLSPLTADDRDFLTENGLDPELYMLLDLEISENTFYNSTGSNWSVPVKPNDSTSSDKYYEYLATQVFTRAELTVGSVIRINSGYKYRPDGWVSTAKTTSANRPKEISKSFTVIDSAWWADFEYRAFNVSSTTSNKMIYENEGTALKIYVPIAKRAELGAADREYLTSLGLNPDEYRILDYTYTLAAYYNSSTGASKVNHNPDNSFNAQFLCTEIFSRYDLTLGSLIRLSTSGLKYRPEGWTDLEENVTNRPTNVSDTLVTVSAAWWSDFNYRAFNLSRDDKAPVGDSDAACFIIYVKI